jgi:hypothetical protein
MNSIICRHVYIFIYIGIKKKINFLRPQTKESSIDPNRRYPFQNRHLFENFGSTFSGLN